MPGGDDRTATIGIVVIGRNEGLRLRSALVEAQRSGAPVVYVDSASSDDSTTVAAELGVPTVVLDESTPLSAARARNAGAQYFAATTSPPDHLQFIDGDCVLDDTWLDAAFDALESDTGLGAVCGWRREADPQRNVFHEVIDLEWQMGAVGVVPDFAGDVMIRRTAFDAAGGYDPAVMAGEDTEFSSRISAAGFGILRLDRVSTIHDIDMSSIGQWWRRNVRSGLGYGIVAAAHRRTDQLFLARARRVTLWGFVAPVLAIVALPFSRVPAGLFGARLAISSVRAMRSIPAERASRRQRLLWGISCTTSDIPAAVGLAKYVGLRTRSEAPTLIEYQTGPS